MPGSPGGAAPDLARARAELAEVRDENERLMDLLMRLDRERAALEAAHAALLAAAPGRDPGAHGNPGWAPGCADPEAQELARELARERAQRQRAERDFEALMDSLDQERAPAGTGSGEPGGSPELVSPERLAQLQAAVEALERENAALRGGQIQT